MKEKVKIAKDKVEKKVVRNSKFQSFSRFGFVVRGLVYFLFGLLGLEFSAGLRQQGAGFTEAIIFIQKQSFGQFLLIGVILGFASYSIWSFIRAVLDVTKEKGRLSLLIRTGYLGSAFSYAALAASASLFFKGFSIKQDSQVQSELAQKILYLNYGRQLLLVVGIVWILAGIGQIVIALKEKFKKNLQMGKIGEAKEEVGTWLGKIGIASRGVVFFLIGVFIAKAALVLDPSEAVGTEKVMETVKTFSFGPLLLGTICLGLMVFGVFSIFQGIYFKFPSE